VVHYYEEFSNIITGAPYDIKTPFPFDIGAIFFNGVKPTIKNVIRSKKMMIPKATLNELPSASLQRLTAIKDVMAAAKGKLGVIRSEAQVKILAKMGNCGSFSNNHRQNNPSVNMTFASLNPKDPTSFAPSQGLPHPHHLAAMPVSFMSNPAPPPSGPWSPTHQEIRQVVTEYDALARTAEEAMVDAIVFLVFLSVAEEAIRKATRTATPPECWGCHGIPEIHDDHWHLFRECPHKHRSDVQTQFRKHAWEYKAFMEDKRKTCSTDLYRPGATIHTAQIKAQWQVLGFPSAAIANLWDSIDQTTTSPMVRTACFHAIGQQMGHLTAPGGLLVSSPEPPRRNWQPAPVPKTTPSVSFVSPERLSHASTRAPTPTLPDTRRLGPLFLPTAYPHVIVAHCYYCYYCY
jgi:hypothetical protein